MKKLIVLFLFVSPAASAEVFCNWPGGLSHVLNFSDANGPHYVGEQFALRVNLAADWSIQENNGPIQNLGTRAAGALVAVTPPDGGQYKLRAFRVSEGYCTLDDLVLPLPSVGTITRSGALWTVNSITFSASVSGGFSPLTYAWTFGDGGTSTAKSPTHSYDEADTYTVSLTVTDENGRQDSSQRNFTIVDNPNVPGKPINLNSWFMRCPSAYTANMRVFWDPAGSQPSPLYEVQRKVSYSSSWGGVYRTTAENKPLTYLSESHIYDWRVRGCLSTDSATCGPYATGRFSTPECGGGGGGGGPLD